MIIWAYGKVVGFFFQSLTHASWRQRVVAYLQMHHNWLVFFDVLTEFEHYVDTDGINLSPSKEDSDDNKEFSSRKETRSLTAFSFSSAHCLNTQCFDDGVIGIDQEMLLTFRVSHGTAATEGLPLCKLIHFTIQQGESTRRQLSCP